MNILKGQVKTATAAGLLLCIITVFYLYGCAPTRAEVRAKEAIKQAKDESMGLVHRFCLVNDVSESLEKIRGIREGIIWAIECENKIREATAEEKRQLGVFMESAGKWMEEAKSGDRDRLIRWTWEEIPAVFGDGDGTKQ